MPSYTLEIEAFSTYTANMPSLEIWEDGVLDSTHLISSTGTSIVVTINYPGSIPTSLALTFNDAFPAAGRTIEIRSVKINDQYVNIGNFLSTDSLTKSTSANVSINGDSDFLFDSSDPPLSEFTTGATRTLTAGNDIIRTFLSGTPEIFDALAGADRIYLGSGADKVFGNAGADLIRAGAGNDLIFGGDDNDRLFGEDGDDDLYGGNGNDRIHGGAGDDEIHGGAGDDRLNGHDDDDIITGGAGDDKLNGGSGSDHLFGGDDNDQLIGAAGDDTLDGGNGDDIVYGGAGVDHINGGDGTDILAGNTGDDVIHGDDGNDIIHGMEDNDTLYGGNGDDILTGGDGVDIIYGGSDDDTLTGGDGTDTLYGGDGDDILHGSSLTITEISTILNANPNIIYSAVTNSFYQYVTSGITWTAAQTAASATLLNGVNGHLATVTSLRELNYLDSQINPTNDANSGSYFTSGNEVAVLNEWRFTDGIENGVQFSQGATPINGFDNMWAAGQPNSAAQNYVYLWSADDGLADAPDNSTFAHHDGYLIEWEAGLLSDDLAIDTLYGGDGRDYIYGYGGNDVLDGGSGADLLFGGDGDDTLIGGAGDDVISGGTGTDTVDFSGSVGAITASLITNIATGHGTDTLLSIENVIGSAFNDTISGNDTAHNLYGGAGNDIITGGQQIVQLTNGTNVVTYGGGQDGGGTTTYMDDDIGVEFSGNNWKQILGTYTITANTVLEFDFRSTIEAEVTGIGFDTDNGISANRTFELFGTQTWGIQAFNNYDGSGNWIHYEIDVGSHFTGTFSRLTFANDDDGNSPANGTNGNGFFRNIVIHEGAGGSNDLTGGDGLDELYGDSGIDTFIFEDTNDVDIIHYFNTQDGDVLDISDILTNFIGGTSDIDDYVNFTNNGDHVTMSVDINGTTGGANFVDIAELRGQSDLDETTLYTNGNIIA